MDWIISDEYKLTVGKYSYAKHCEFPFCLYLLLMKNFYFLVCATKQNTK